MADLRGVLGLALLLLVAVAFSRHRRGISVRTVVAALALQVAFALLVLRWGPGEAALRWVSGRVEALIGFTEEGTRFVFGSLLDVGPEDSPIFALKVLPVIVFLGALVYLLFYLRVIQWVTHWVGGAIAWLLRVTKVESMYAATVIFLGQSEAPLMVAPYLARIRTAQLFALMTGGFAAAAGSTLVGYSLLGAPLEYLLAATVMNAPAGLLMAKILWPDSTPEPDWSTIEQAAADSEEAAFDVRTVRDEESANVIDAVGRGALAGGRIAVTVGALLVAFVALIAMLNAVLSRVGSWVGVDDLTFQGVLGWLLAPLAWLLGVPWSEAPEAGSFIGQKTILNEFVAYADFGAQVDSLSPVTVVVVTFALAGFANLASIAIQIGTYSALVPERRAQVARLGLLALLGGSLANLANAAVAGLVVAT
ncbi:transporter [Marmoricola sp. Leaf446]|uniref:NupC/NupG family nucleoside CNT transporter n=1 Tax=Marmoricola sp. Leaf446 TaxID=1736379 RepID=UPI0006FFF561|nr:nucleoside transporter C-terminal domain-containing protein [Marmoricola sp. Leaf446]KQT91439.1 transporter [Marmoricola sp. Leaf446]